MDVESAFVRDGDDVLPTEWAVGPWSADLLQGSACGALLVRELERSRSFPDMIPGRLSFDLWRPVTRERIATSVRVLREGRKAGTAEATLSQSGKVVARCTAVYLAADPASTPPVERPSIAAPGPLEGRPVPAAVKRWSPFFTGVDTRVIAGDLLKPGPASAWFNLERPIVAGEETSAVAHAVSAADLTSGISAVVDLRSWTFVNPDLTVLLWRTPRPPWILLAAETDVGDRGTGVARGVLSDVDGPFGTSAMTLLFDRRR